MSDVLHLTETDRYHIQMALPGVSLPAGDTITGEELAALHATLRSELRIVAPYVPTPIITFYRTNLQPAQVQGAFWRGTVLFADLTGFTALSSQLRRLGKQGAEEISLLINRLFDALVREIQQASGYLMKFGGDALLAFFDEQLLGEYHASAAALAALAIQQRMRDFALVTTRAGNFALGMRIGVHSGDLFAAHVGDAEHLEFVLAGQTMNLVAQAQEHAVTGEVIITDACRTALPDALVQPQQQGFGLLQQVPPLPVPLPHVQRGWEGHTDMLEDTRRLALVLMALRRYLPGNLPRRFLEGQAQQSVGEFRRVTVMFINFTGTSTLAEALAGTPDIAAHTLNSYFQRVQQVIHRYGGIVNKVDLAPAGDKLMALFGAPVSHEDDAERAVRAALELQHALAEANREAATYLPDHAPLFRHRIGISTGTVFAGLVGSARRHEYTVMGHHANVAARLMMAAGEGHILLAPSTRRAVERRFALRDLPALRLRGVPEPVVPAEPLYAYDVVHDLPGTLARPPLVGRQHMLDQLVREARRGLRGNGRVLSLVGQAGIGKTRLIEETLTQLVHASGSGAVPAFVPYTIACQSYEQTTPYAAIRDMLRQFGALHGDAHEQTAQIAQMVLQRLPDQERFIPLLGDVLGTPIPDTPATAALSPEQRHERTIELVLALISAETRHSPLILIVDDLHWIDASSLETLNALAERATQWPLVLLLAYRNDPPIANTWRELPHSLLLQVRELPADASALLAEHMLHGSLPEPLLPVLERTQGNPFFIGEVIRELVDLGALRSNADTWELTRPVDEVGLPDSIEGIIIARLDRLEERSREVLQAAAVVGRRFSHYVLAGLLAHSPVDERLYGLTRAELIHSDEHDRDGAYLFTQALTRDVAYEAILYAQRRDLHRLVAHQIEHLYSDRLEPHLTLLARHYLLAEQWQQAFAYHLRAGRNAQVRYANREAIELFMTAIGILPRLNAEEHAHRAVEAHERLGYTYAMTSEYGLALQHYETALALLQQQPDHQLDDMLRLHHHIARVFEKRAEFERAFEWVEQALALAGNVTSRDLARCLLLGAGLHRRQGRTNQAIAWGERALTMADHMNDIAVKAHALKLLGIAYLHLGNTTQAYSTLRDSVDAYARCNDMSGHGDAHNDLANTCYELGRMDEARQHYEAALAIKEVIGDRYGQAMVLNNLGEIFKLQGRFEEATVRYQHSLDLFERIKSVYGAGVLHMNLGAVFIQRGMTDEAANHLRKSAELYEQAGAEDSLPELERYIAELQVLRGDLTRAQFAIELALATADRLEARAEEGTTRRLYGQILALTGQVYDAWDQMIASLTMLQETATPLEVARTNLAIAMLAPHLKRKSQGQHALNEALLTLEAIGAHHDIEEALQVAAMHSYTIVPPTEI